MTETELRARFAELNVWRSGDERAPHKPLLLLLALGRVLRGEPRLVRFADVAPRLTELLIDFGPPRRTQHPEYPFLRLQTDAVWQVTGSANETLPIDATLAELRSSDARGGFTPEVHATLSRNATLVGELANVLLQQSFPESLHAGIAQAAGIDLLVSVRRPRDPTFRDRVLVAYGYACAVCGFDLRLKNAPVALEAAHIKWHQAGGPAAENNGLVLCSMHHNLFDRGVMSISPERKILVSPLVNGSSGMAEWLTRFADIPLRAPRTPDQTPLADYVAWHVREVFKSAI